MIQDTPTIKEVMEMFDQGDEYVLPAENKWNKDNIKGYLQAKKEFRPWLEKALTLQRNLVAKKEFTTISSSVDN